MSGTAWIAIDMVLSGILHAKDQTVIIEGSFEGEVYADNIFVHIGARFEGVAVSRTAEIDGVFAGILETDALIVHDNAKMSANIIADSLVIDSGADITGLIMRKTPLA